MEYKAPKLTMVYFVEEDVITTSITEETERATYDLSWDNVFGGEW